MDVVLMLTAGAHSIQRRGIQASILSASPQPGNMEG